MLTHIPKYQWLTFCATFLLGLLTHLFMLVNKLPNHDDIGHIIYSNNAYLKMHLGYEQTYSHSTRLLSAIEGTEGYDRSIPVVFIGAEDYTVLKNPTPELDRTGDIGVFAMGNHLTSYTYDLFLKRFLGFTNPLYLDGTPQSDSCDEQESVKAMPVYPAAGSIAAVDGIMVVKLNGN